MAALVVADVVVVDAAVLFLLLFLLFILIIIIIIFSFLKRHSNRIVAPGAVQNHYNNKILH